MLPGDIILVRGKTPIISSLIRWFTNSEYTHVGIAVGKNHIYEIDMNAKMGIHPMKHEDYDIFRYKHGLTREEMHIMKNYAIEQAIQNQGYDWLKIIAFALEKFFKGPFLYDTINKEVCSEIVDKIYAAAGIDLLPDRVDGHVRPADLANSPLLYKVERLNKKAS